MADKAQKLRAAIEDFNNQGFDPNDEVIETTIVALYYDNTSKGAGPIRILKNKTNGRYRIVMRKNKEYTLFLNHYINPDIEFRNEGQFIIYSTTDFAESPQGRFLNIQLKFPPELNVDEFLQKLQTAQAENKKLLG